MKKAIFQVDGFKLCYSQEGTGPQAFVIGSHLYYPRVFSKKLKEQLHFVFMDHRGFCPQDHPYDESDFHLVKLINDIENLRKKLKIEKMILIGHSIHAFMALEYARAFPDRVSHLILMASSPLVGPEIYKEADQYFEESVCPERKVAFATRMQKFFESGDQSFIARLLSFSPRIWYDANFDASKLWDGVEVNSTGVEIIWGSMFADYDTKKALKAIQCPIFLALGRYDYFNPPHLWERYRDYASNLTIRIFEKSGHTPPLEEADNFDREVLTWLKDNVYTYCP